MQVLVIEDDPKIARFLSEGLTADGHGVTVASEGNKALETALSRRFDLVLLDLMLPGLSGQEILRALRTVDVTTPVIAITALDGVENRVIGLDLGADDYMVKPFSFVELQARIRSLFRRTGQPIQARVVVGALELDRTRRIASLGDKSVELSNREFQLLEFFMLNAGDPQTRARIADRVWGYQFDTGTNVIDVYVNYVRNRLKDLGLKPIKTLRGIGYVLEPDACELAIDP